MPGKAIHLGNQFLMGMVSLCIHTRKLFYRPGLILSVCLFSLDFFAQGQVTLNGRPVNPAFYRFQAEKGDANAMLVLSMIYLRGNGISRDSIEAYKWLEKSAKAGNSFAMYDFARLTRNNKIPGQDSSKSLIWLLASAELGNTRAMMQLGALNMAGKDLPKDTVQGLDWFIKAAEAGNPQAMYLLGMMYDNGRQVPKDSMKALSWYQKGADASDPEAQNNLGIKYRKGRWVERDYKKALNLFRASADGGSAFGMFNLGYMYQYGKGVKQDDEKALEWYRKSDAKSDRTGASYYIGYFYETGRGVKQDIHEAIKWYVKSKVKEVAAAGMVRLGIIFETGKAGIVADTAGAMKFYENAAADGNPSGMMYLGHLYQGRHQYKVFQDSKMIKGIIDSCFAKALAGFKKEIARSLDDTEAMIGLAMMYENGYGTEKNIQQAIEWYTRAAALGDIEAKAKLANFK